MPTAATRAVFVCPIIPAPDSGGQKRTLRLLEAAERAGARPLVLSNDATRAQEAQALRGRGWEVEVIDQREGGLARRAGQHARGLPSPHSPRLAARLEQTVREGAAFVQLEHTQSAPYLPQARGGRSVLSTHNVDSRMLASLASGGGRLSPARARAGARARAMRRVERRFLPMADTVVCVSEHDRELLEAQAASVVVVANGVDEELFELPEPADGETVLFFGDFEYEPNARGVARFLSESWPLVARERPAARLRLVGRGAVECVGELAARTPGAEAVGFVPSVADELAAAQLVAVPVWQGGGTRLKVLEAMAAARPVVGTSLGVEGLGFEPGRHGLVADDARGLAEGVAGLLGDPARARRLGAAGREHARPLRWSEVTAPLEHLYRQWLEPARA